MDSGNSGNVGNAVSRTVSIGLIGPAIVVLTPLAAFTYAPALPAVFDVVSVDASTSTVNGAVCGSSCTYAWIFGDGTTRTGITETHRYQAQGVFRVTLTVTTSSGTSSTAVQTVTVGAPAALTPVITFSPTNPRFTETVAFDGRGSTAPGAATIASYAWDFGNGVTATGATASTSYESAFTPATARTYTVRLIITDSFGRTGTTTTSVLVSP